MYDLSNRKVEHLFVQKMFSCYADVLFITLPFLLAYFVQWSGNSDEEPIPFPPYLAIMTCIFVGMSLGRIFYAFATDQSLARYKVRLCFAMAMMLTLLFGPSLAITLTTLDLKPYPDYLHFVQPILFIISVSLYSVSFNVRYFLLRFDSSNANSNI